LSSAPSEPLLCITTNFAPKNSSSYKRALKKLRPGDKASITDPMGDFILPKDPRIPLVFVAAGIGCAPYAGIIKWLTSREEKRPIQLIYAASTPEDFIFHNLWKNYPLDFKPLLSRPHSAWQGLSGRLTTKRLQQMLEPLGDKLVYLAGPQSMIEPLYNELVQAGNPRSQLLLDYFPGY
jgi:ferredoxin-NADP reductase